MVAIPQAGPIALGSARQIGRPRLPAVLVAGGAWIAGASVLGAITATHPFGEVQLAFMFFFIAALAACSAAGARGLPVWITWTGILVAAVGVASVFWSSWRVFSPFPAGLPGPVVGYAFLAATWCSAAGLLCADDLALSPRPWLRRLGCAAAAVFATSCALGLVHGIETPLIALLMRGSAAVMIEVVLLEAARIVAWRIAAGRGSFGVVDIELACPRCGRRHVGATGASRCAHCGIVFDLDVDGAILRPGTAPARRRRRRSRSALVVGCVVATAALFTGWTEEQHALVIAMCGSGFVVTLSAGAAIARVDRLAWSAWLGLAAGVAGVFTMLGAAESGLAARVTASAFILAASLSCVGIGAAWWIPARWAGPVRLLVVIVVLLGVSMAVTIWSGRFLQGDEGWVRLLAALATMLMLFIVPLSLAVRTRSRPKLESVSRTVHLVCPRCRREQERPLGRTSCTSCSLAMSVQVAEARCGRCGFILHGMLGVRCPECGTRLSPRELMYLRSGDGKDGAVAGHVVRSSGALGASPRDGGPRGTIGAEHGG